MSRQRGDGDCEKIEYPFAVVLRLRVGQVVCGISALLMGAVALIEEKSSMNLGIGVPAGVSTIIAAANNIYCSRGFDGYQPSSCQPSSHWNKFRILGSTWKLAAVNIILWSLATALLITLVFKAVNVLLTGEASSVTIDVIAVTELILCACVLGTVCAITWVDSYYDPDCQDCPDLAHSNTGTAVSMITISQCAPTV